MLNVNKQSLSKNYDNLNHKLNKIMFGHLLHLNCFHKLSVVILIHNVKLKMKVFKQYKIFMRPIKKK